MTSVGRLELGITLFVLGFVIGLGSLALRPLIRRSRRHGEPSLPADLPVQQRPVWVVVLLSILSLGIYLYIWFGQSWSDLQRGVGDLDMSPSSHLWAMGMGFDFFARLRTHFRTINEQCALRNLPPGPGPGLAIAMIASFVLIPVLVGKGQQSLNRIWEHDFGAASRRNATSGEWIAIIALGLMGASIVVFIAGAAWGEPCERRNAGARARSVLRPRQVRSRPVRMEPARWRTGQPGSCTRTGTSAMAKTCNEAGVLRPVTVPSIG